MISLSKIKKIKNCVPKKYQKKLLPFFGFSFINVVLDLLSVAYLIPVLIVALNNSNPVFENNFSFFLFQKEHLVFSLCLLISFFIIKNIISILFINYQNRLIFDISSEITKHYTDSFIHNNFLFYQNQDKGEIIRNTIEVPNNFSNFILLSLSAIISESCIISIITITGLILFPIITSISILVFLLSLFMIYTFRKLKKINKSLSEDYQININALLDLINGFFEIKSASKEETFLNKFNHSNKKLNKTYSFLTTIRNSNAKYLEIVIIVIIAVLVFYLINLTDNTSENILLISFFASVFFKLIPSLNKLIIASSNIKSYSYTIPAILNHTIPHHKIKSAETSIEFKKEIHLKDISFSYLPENPLITNSSLIIPKGKITSISGRSGTGKTTLLHILLNLIPPDTGKILVDDAEINQSQKNAFLSLTGYVTQDPFLFNGTILENIAIGEPEEKIDFQRIEELMDNIGFREVIANFPEGIRTYSGNGGRKLSGGQKQKLAIIRALYNRPQLLILDEATNQLDEENESKIFQYLQKLVSEEKLTVLLISHDPKILAQCDIHYQFQNSVLYEV